MRLLRACYDWRVITVVAAVGLGIYLAAPRLVATMVPLLVFAVCPLSMLLMMRSMGSHQVAEPVAQPALDAAEVSRAALRSELAAIARQQARLTAQLEALEDRNRGKAVPDRKTPDGPSIATGPQFGTRRSQQGPSQM
jgi:Protein of unknown function (DUF2933)